MPYGIDVSNVNGSIRWKSVPQEIEFAHVKASEGGSFSDPNFLTNVAQARTAGLHVGPYHFGRPDHHPGAAGARAEAQFFVSKIRPALKTLDIRPVLDLEVGSGDLTSWAGAFLAEVEHQTGVRPMLYTYSAFARAHLKMSLLKGYGLWIAEYGPNDGRDHGASMGNVEHQFTSVAKVSGVLGHVDKNVAPSLAPLLVSPPKPTPKPKPKPKPSKLWPVPIPAWFWTWAQWRKDGQTYARPLDAPSVIPPWAWARLRALG